MCWALSIPSPGHERQRAGLRIGMDNVLVLVRHGESEWNKLNLFTGWKDPNLSDKGVAEAHKAGQLLKAQGLKFDIAFTSALQRAQRTLDIMLAELGQPGLPMRRDQRLNERDYGELPASTRMRRASAGARSRCTFGGAASMSPHGWRKLKRYGRARPALLSSADLARGCRRSQCARCGSRQLATCAHCNWKD